jgi:tetratricopeptide (TPR) repeat protein
MLRLAMASKIQRAIQSPARLEAESAQADEQALLTLLKDGEPGAALALAPDLTQRFADRGLGWKVLGALLWAEGCVAEALMAMQTSVRLLPRDAEAHSNLGQSFSMLERFDEAEACLRQALQIDPDFATAHYRLGMTYYMQARMPEAEASLRAGVSSRAGYFVASGVDWAERLAALAELRAGLRVRWPHSPARRPDTIATALDTALRHMWRRWCANLPAESFHASGADVTSS